MQRRVLLALMAGGSACAALVVGCIDLFHSTDFDNECALDAAACPAIGDEAHPGDGPNSGGDGSPDQDGTGGDGGAGDADGAVPPTNFCSWDAPTAQAAARRACIWLGACFGAYGNNELGTCLDYALRAYDCTIDPSFPLATGGDAHRYWDCLQKAQSCGDVTGCVFPGLSTQCPGNQVVCNASTRMNCSASGSPPVSAEACIAVGQTCGTPGGSVECSAAADGKCNPLSCDGTTILRDCDSSGKIERGVDCANYGARSCTTRNLTTDAGADATISTCVPFDAGGACAPSPNVYCDTGIVTACFTGTLQRFDCRELFEDAGASCDTAAGGTKPIWDLSRYCVPTGGPCTESCDGGVFVACHGTKPVTIDCKSYTGKSECRMDTYGIPSHPACAKP